MEAPVPAAFASPQKRPRDDAVEPCISTPNRTAPSTTSTPLTVMSSLDTPSPLKLAKIEAAAPTSSSNFTSAVCSSQPPPSSTNNQPPTKRRKFTPQEKEEQAKEKEAKAKARAEMKAQKEAADKLKAEQKAQKDEEKRAKDEEKRKEKEEKEEEKRAKEEERRKKNEEREEKKRAKELKQQQEEEEKRKKERSQMRLNAFFTKPKPTAHSSKKNTTVESNQKTHIPIGQTPISADTVEKVTDSIPPSPQKAIVQNAQSDYDRVFLPFCLPPHAILAPINPLLSAPEDLAAARSRLDDIVAHKDVGMEPANWESLRSLLPERHRGLQMTTIEEIIERVNGSAENPVDLTGDNDAKPLEMLQQIPMKYLHFGEDVRPPYFGTYTKLHAPDQERKVARNPISRGLFDLNYEYDSEAEWEDPGEGEDLDSEGEEDLDDDGEEDMDGFLDDEDDPEVKRRQLNGDQEPVSTGLCWEDVKGVSRLNDGSGAISTELKEFKMGFLLEPQLRSIDPFSDAYWAPEPTAAPTSHYPVNKTEHNNGAMNPPRLPLANRPINGLMNTLNPTQKTISGATAKAAKGAKRMIPPELLPAFKEAVEGQDLTKIGMIEALKKKFPKIPKDALTNTLTDVAQRIGPSAAEKRWVLLNN